MDSAFIWYDIDESKLYATGFSWGGKTTYTYGLNHIEKFAGLLPIGAAVNVNEIDGIDSNAEGVPVYIVHGSLDSPNSRFYPLLEAMEDNGACVESNLLSGVGHTIDFNNQVEILTEAYEYLQENECVTTSSEEIEIKEASILSNSIFSVGQMVQLNLPQNTAWQVFTLNGQMVIKGKQPEATLNMGPGIYVIRSGNKSQLFSTY